MKSKIGMGALVACLVAPVASHAGWKFFNPMVESDIPAVFSQTGFYSNWAAKTVTPEATPYEVNSALWSDGAHKSRWFILPPGTKILFDEKSDYWDYPNHATFVKLFKHELVPGDASSEIYWETRVLVNKEDSISGGDYWYGFTYKWNADGSDARLIGSAEDDSALNIGMTFWPKGKANAPSIKKWHFPDRNQCMQCHRIGSDSSIGNHGRSVLGFFTAQINRGTKADPSVNQITEFFNKGLFTWMNKGVTMPSAIDLASMPRWYSITDSTKDLNQRARAYIAANCSGCHGDRGLAENAAMASRINYDFYQGKGRFPFANKELGGDFGIEGSALIVPGSPEKSIILFRQKQRPTYAMDIAEWMADTTATKPPTPPLNFYAPRVQMPPLATYEEDTTATKILAQWINTFDVNADRDTLPEQTFVSIRSSAKAHALQIPRWNAKRFTIPSGMSGRVALLGIDGREYPLARVSEHAYSAPDHLRPGIYILRVGAQAFTQYLY